MTRLYTYLALLVFNTLLLFAAVNGAAALYLAWRGPQPTAYDSHWLIDAYGFELLAEAYPGWDEDELRLLLTESSNWLLGYEPFTQFRPVTRADTYITIDPAGFRVSPPQGPWPPSDDAVNVFVFGGSTVMGAGVPDDSTIPAQLQRRLRAECNASINVYNFGRGFYYSTQERILFERLLSADIRPDAALFLDGVTDFYFADDTPQLTGRIAGFVDAANRAKTPERPEDPDLADRMQALLEALPVWKLWQTSMPTLISDASAAPFEASPARDGEAQRVIERWQRNRRLIEAAAAVFDVPLLFAWLPAPTYGYDLDFMNLHRAGKLEFGRHALSGNGYRLMAGRVERGEMGPDFLWLGEMQRDERINLYVDSAHYTIAFSRKIADALFDGFVARQPDICTR